MSTDYITVITTISNQEDADNIANHVLQKKLAGCIQIIGPITSHYWWQNEICHDQEWMCLIKTEQGVYDRLEKAIKEIHPYEVPEIIALPILKGSEDYLSWLGQSIQNNNP